MQKMGNREFVIASAFAAADMLVILGRLGEAEKALRGAIKRAGDLGPAAETKMCIRDRGRVCPLNVN